jgi:hypothetical protein
MPGSSSRHRRIGTILIALGFEDALADTDPAIGKVTVEIDQPVTIAAASGTRAATLLPCADLRAGCILDSELDHAKHVLVHRPYRYLIKDLLW